MLCKELEICHNSYVQPVTFASSIIASVLPFPARYHPLKPMATGENEI